MEASLTKESKYIRQIMRLLLMWKNRRTGGESEQPVTSFIFEAFSLHFLLTLIMTWSFIINLIISEYKCNTASVNEHYKNVQTAAVS